MKDLKKKIINKIQEEKLKPKNKWRFQLREFLIWFCFGALIALTALFFSGVIFNISQIDWGLRSRLGFSRPGFFLINMPYLWLIAVISLVVLAYYFFRHTDKGYRYTLPLILVAVFLLSILFGFLMHYSIRTGKFLEDSAVRHSPFYKKTSQRMMWLNPEKGLIVGEVVSSYKNDLFKLEDLRGKVWEVNCGNCLILAPFDLREGVKIKIIGKILEDEKFKAEEIQPFLSIKK